MLESARERFYQRMVLMVWINHTSMVNNISFSERFWPQKKRHYNDPF
jgi:hypothetical protein